MRFDSDKAMHYITTEPLWRIRYAAARTIEERWMLIREIYRDRMPEILARSAQHRRARISPYFVDWQFTPIETIAWQTIRYLGTPLYPQVPVDRYFIDFASPHFKIGLELDGAQYHDRDRDYHRDCRLLELGWQIFRIRGAEAYASSQLPDDYEEHPAFWLCETSDGIITALDHMFFRENPEQWKYFDLALQSLEEHRLAPFSLYPEGD